LFFFAHICMILPLEQMISGLQFDSFMVSIPAGARPPPVLSE
jgi:hypothetical protein